VSACSWDFLTVLVLVSMAEPQRQGQPVEDEAAVATAIPDPQGVDAD